MSIISTLPRSVLVLLALGLSAVALSAMPQGALLLFKPEARLTSPAVAIALANHLPELSPLVLPAASTRQIESLSTLGIKDGQSLSPTLLTEEAPSLFMQDSNATLGSSFFDTEPLGSGEDLAPFPDSTP